MESALTLFFYLCWWSPSGYCPRTWSGVAIPARSCGRGSSTPSCCGPSLWSTRCASSRAPASWPRRSQLTGISALVDDLVHGQAGPARIFADHALGETAKNDGSPFRLLTVGT
jgi:hypothetical protein